MPIVRLCPYCKKGFLKSTYQMLKHVQNCEKYNPTIIHVNNNTKNSSNFKIKKIADEIKPSILFSYKPLDSSH